MAMLIVTILVELASLTAFFVMLKNRKRGILKWILCGITAITQFGFWYLAVKYLTVFICVEVTLEISAILWWIYLGKRVTVEKSEKNTKRRGFWERNVLFSISGFLVWILFFTIVFTYPSNIRWTDDGTALGPITEQLIPPANLQELKPQFCCVHNSKEKKYDLYWVWNNGVYQVSSYTEDECTVYRLSDSRQDMPKLETNEETFYKYNYNYEMFEEPTLVDTKKEKTYTLYVCESSYKEVYTEE